jgi:hypothetical protein
LCHIWIKSATLVKTKLSLILIQAIHLLT